MKRRTRRMPVTRQGKMVGGYVPETIAEGIDAWMRRDAERSISSFIRAAAREKLIRDGIAITAS